MRGHSRSPWELAGAFGGEGETHTSELGEVPAGQRGGRTTWETGEGR